MVTIAPPNPFAFADPATVPDLPDFTTYYGVRLSPIGEEGDVVMLGHPGKLRALAALRAWLRYCEGGNVGADEQLHRNTTDDLADQLEHRYAVVLTHCIDHPRCGDDDISKAAGECWRCAEIASYPWWLSCNAAPDTPGAFPITYWSA